MFLQRHPANFFLFFDCFFSPSNAFVHDKNIYSHVRDLRVLIDTISISNLNSLSDIIYSNVLSLTLIANKSFDEQRLLRYLLSIIDRTRIFYLTIQTDNISKSFLSNLLENFSQLRSLTISTYYSWTKLNQLSSFINNSHIQTLIVNDVLNNLHQYYFIYQLFNQLEVLSVILASVDDCYALLALLFVENNKYPLEYLRLLTIKCDFDEPDTIAYWIRSNIFRKLSYKCTTNVLTIWL